VALRTTENGVCLILQRQQVIFFSRVGWLVVGWMTLGVASG